MHHQDGKDSDRKFRLNGEQGIVSAVRQGLKLNGGYCPCRFERTPDTKCICREFREQLEDDSFSGYCRCLLYYKPPAEESSHAGRSKKHKH